MIPLRYFAREGLHIVASNRKISLLASAIIALSLFFMGFFFLITHNLRGAETAWRTQQKMVVFLTPSAAAAERTSLEKALAAAPFVKRWEFQSSEAALRKFKSDFPSLGDVLNEARDNPFAPSYELLLDPGHERQASDFRESLQKAAGVAEVQYDIQWLQTLNTFVYFLRWIGIALGLLLGGGAVLIVMNVVRIATLVHREEIDILWLVGAPPQYIRGPFLFQGLLLGLGGGLLSLLLLYGVYQALAFQIRGHFHILWNFMALSFLPASTLLILLGCGLLCGLAGSLLLKFGEGR